MGDLIPSSSTRVDVLSGCDHGSRVQWQQDQTPAIPLRNCITFGTYFNALNLFTCIIGIKNPFFVHPVTDFDFFFNPLIFFFFTLF